MKAQAVTSEAAVAMIRESVAGAVLATADPDPEFGDRVVPFELRQWLARLRLLEAVPFAYLAADSELLPLESIRFFYLDRAWADALVQGALSVGTVSSADRAQLEAVYPHIVAEVDDAERRVRKPGNEQPLQGASGTVTGFLLRSKLVSGWPNLHVRAYARDVLEDDVLTTTAESDPSRLKVLRLERLAPAVLLALFDGVPHVVHLEEPRAGVQFGVDETGDADATSAVVRLRDPATGTYLDPGRTASVRFRRGSPGVVHFGGTIREISAGLSATRSLDSAEVAMQLLQFPYRAVFGDRTLAGGTGLEPGGAFHPTIGFSVLAERFRP